MAEGGDRQQEAAEGLIELANGRLDTGNTQETQEGTAPPINIFVTDEEMEEDDMFSEDDETTMVNNQHYTHNGTMNPEGAKTDVFGKPLGGDVLTQPILNMAQGGRTPVHSTPMHPSPGRGKDVRQLLQHLQVVEPKESPRPGGLQAAATQQPFVTQGLNLPAPLQMQERNEEQKETESKYTADQMEDVKQKIVQPNQPSDNHENQQQNISINLQQNQLLRGLKEMSLTQEKALNNLSQKMKQENTSLNQLAPKPFSGGTYENVIDWTEKFQEYAQFSRWDESKMLRALPLMLADKVRSWYRSLDPLSCSNWNDAKQQLITQYGPTQRTFWEQTELIDRKQAAGESVTSYTAEMSKRLELLGIQEPEKTKIYVRGLLPSLQIYVCEGSVQNFNDAEKRALRKESQEQKLKQEKEAISLSTSNSGNDVLAQVLNYMENHQQQNQRQKGNNRSYQNPHPRPQGGNYQRSNSMERNSNMQSGQFNRGNVSTVNQRSFNNRPWQNKGQQKTQACYRCGSRNHMAHNCRWANAKCHFCSKLGHIAVACKQRISANRGQQGNHLFY